MKRENFCFSFLHADLLLLSFMYAISFSYFLVYFIVSTSILPPLTLYTSQDNFSIPLPQSYLNNISQNVVTGFIYIENGLQLQYDSFNNIIWGNSNSTNIKMVFTYLNSEGHIRNSRFDIDIQQTQIQERNIFYLNDLYFIPPLQNSFYFQVPTNYQVNTLRHFNHAVSVPDWMHFDQSVVYASNVTFFDIQQSVKNGQVLKVGKELILPLVLEGNTFGTDVQLLMMVPILETNQTKSSFDSVTVTAGQNFTYQFNSSTNSTLTRRILIFPNATDWITVNNLTVSGMPRFKDLGTYQIVLLEETEADNGFKPDLFNSEGNDVIQGEGAVYHVLNLQVQLGQSVAVGPVDQQSDSLASVYGVSQVLSPFAVQTDQTLQVYTLPFGSQSLSLQTVRGQLLNDSWLHASYGSDGSASLLGFPIQNQTSEYFLLANETMNFLLPLVVDQHQIPEYSIVSNIEAKNGIYFEYQLPQVNGNSLSVETTGWLAYDVPDQKLHGWPNTTIQVWLTVTDQFGSRLEFPLTITVEQSNSDSSIGKGWTKTLMISVIVLSAVVVILVVCWFLYKRLKQQRQAKHFAFCQSVLEKSGQMADIPMVQKTADGTQNKEGEELILGQTYLKILAGRAFHLQYPILRMRQYLSSQSISATTTTTTTPINGSSSSSGNMLNRYSSDCSSSTGNDSVWTRESSTSSEETSYKNHAALFTDSTLTSESSWISLDTPTQQSVLYQASLKGGTPLPTWIHFNQRKCSLFGIPYRYDCGRWEIHIKALIPDGQNIYCGEVLVLDVYEEFDAENK